VEAGCACCGGAPAVGVLCATCRERVPVCDGQIPGHVSARATGREAIAALIDAFGVPHPLAAGRAVVGRRPEADLVVLNASVSRDHAELGRGEQGFTVRDLGSRNGTHVDGRRLRGRAALPDRAQVRFGEVAFLFVARAIAMPASHVGSIETLLAERGPFRFNLRGDAVDLCLVGAAGEDGLASGGALLYRRDAAAGWAEVSLAPLEFQLLRALCVRALEEDASPSRARGCVPTKQLARTLPFQSRYANEENVRQVVRRVRATLAELGAEGLLAAEPGRGYYVAWPVLTG
jgi:hypothetical protein